MPRSEFGDKPADPQLVPLTAFRQTALQTSPFAILHGTDKAIIPAGIIDRVDASFHDSTYFKIFDMMVGILGRNPAYSYGLAILIFAIFYALDHAADL